MFVIAEGGADVRGTQSAQLRVCWESKLIYACGVGLVSSLYLHGVNLWEWNHFVPKIDLYMESKVVKAVSRYNTVFCLLLFFSLFFLLYSVFNFKDLLHAQELMEKVDCSTNRGHLVKWLRFGPDCYSWPAPVQRLKPFLWQQRQIFNPNHDLYLTVNTCFLCLNLITSEVLSQYEIEMKRFNIIMVCRNVRCRADYGLTALALTLPWASAA